MKKFLIPIALIIAIVCLYLSITERYSLIDDPSLSRVIYSGGFSGLSLIIISPIIWMYSIVTYKNEPLEIHSIISFFYAFMKMVNNDHPIENLKLAYEGSLSTMMLIIVIITVNLTIFTINEFKLNKSYKKTKLP